MSRTRPAAPAREGFRQSMAWLHTWAGLVLGWLLFAIFLTGSLSLFRSEFNLWARPELTALDPLGPGESAAPGADHALQTLHRTVPDVSQWILRLPDERQPAITLLWRNPTHERFETWLMDPRSGARLDTRDSMGGEFFYRFHFELRTAKNGRWALEGRWVVGVATLLMLVALLTGIVTHRRIFKDFFTFRPAKGGQRAWLDAHNVSGVLALPFYLLITVSGLMIFHTLYLPAGVAAAYPGAKGPDLAAYQAELQGDMAGGGRRSRRAPAGEGVPPMAVAPVLAAAQALWPEGRTGLLQPQRTASGAWQLEASRHEGDRLQYRPERWLFDPVSARPLQHLDGQGPGVRTQGVLYGLHLARFASPGLRWVLFGLGLLGTAMIGTGLLLWQVKRQPHHARTAALPPPWGHRLVASLNQAAIGGLPWAIGVYLAANRLLPADLPGRADVELQAFFTAWGLALLHALAAHLGRRPRAGWGPLLAASGALWLALPVISAATTPAHLGHTLAHGLWPWAAVDLGQLATGALLGVLAWRQLPSAGRASVPPLPSPHHHPAQERHA